MSNKINLLEEKVNLQMAEKYAKEENEVRNYVLTRKLLRPKTNIFSIVCSIVGYVLVCFSLSHTIIDLFKIKSCAWLIYMVIYIVVGLFYSNRLCIRLVECYQHYAKEETRRRCLCKPTCSEYAIAVLKKYFIFVALHKIRIRLFRTCKDGIYKIDLP